MYFTVNWASACNHLISFCVTNLGKVKFSRKFAVVHITRGILLQAAEPAWDSDFHNSWMMVLCSPDKSKIYCKAMPIGFLFYSIFDWQPVHVGTSYMWLAASVGTSYIWMTASVCDYFSPSRHPAFSCHLLLNQEFLSHLSFTILSSYWVITWLETP